MRDREVITAILRSLDWGDDAPLASTDGATRLIRTRLGDGAARWVAGAVEHASEVVRHWDGADHLAPWAEVSTLAQQTLAVALLELAGQPHPEADPPRAVDHELAEDIVARDVKVATVIRGLRIMQDEWVSLLVESAQALPGGPASVPELVRSVTDAVDGSVDALVAAVDEERRRIQHHGAAHGRATIEALLAGQVLDEDMATETLKLPMVDWHLGCVVDVPLGHAFSRTAVEAVAATFADAAGGGLRSRYETGVGQVWLWVTSRRLDRAPAPDDLRLPDHLAVGIGEPHQGIAGFRRTHLEASDALQLGLQCAEPRSLRYRDVALATLLNQDRERAQWFVETELGGLSADTPDMHELRRTLHVYFATRMRVAPAADQLYIHRNTMRDRLRRIERLLGYRPADRPAVCQAALQLSELTTPRASAPVTRPGA